MIQGAGSGTAAGGGSGGRGQVGKVEVVDKEVIVATCRDQNIVNQHIVRIKRLAREGNDFVQEWAFEPGAIPRIVEDMGDAGDEKCVSVAVGERGFDHHPKEGDA